MSEGETLLPCPIVISYGDDGIRVGVHGLDAKEMQEALCVAIYHVMATAVD